MGDYHKDEAPAVTYEELRDMHNDARGRCVECSEHLAELVDACKSLLEIVNQSTGIVGWHLNGDVLRWEQCDPITEIEDTIAKVQK